MIRRITIDAPLWHIYCNSLVVKHLVILHLCFTQKVNNMTNRISIDPDICNGRPVIDGTRIPVYTILEFLGAGDSIEDMLEEYPSLKKEDIYACIQFASKLMANHYKIESIA